MTFLNASLLIGLLAAAIPIAVHLISNRQPRRVIFPATRFLKQQMQSSRTRLRVQRWWLLALRVLGLLALAAALAQPQIETSMSGRWLAIALLTLLGGVLLAMAAVAMVRGLSSRLRYSLAAAGVLTLLSAAVASAVSAVSAPQVVVTDQSPVALAIVIDNSVRTARLHPAEQRQQGDGGEDRPASVIELAREHAAWMIGRYPPESRFAVIDRSPRPAAFALDVAAANRQLSRTEPLALTRPLSERVEAAVRLVRSSDLPRRMVMVITDLTQASFPADQWDDGSLAALLAEDPPLRLQILDIGAPPAGNRRLGPLTLSDATPPQLTPTAISAVLSTQQAIADSTANSPADADPVSVTVEMQLYDTAAAEAAGLPVIRDSQTLLPPLRSVDRTTVELAAADTRVMLSVPPLQPGTHHGLVRIVGEDELAIDDTRYFTLQVRLPVPVLVVASDRESAAVIAEALTAPLSMTDPLAKYRIEIADWLPSRREGYDAYRLVVLVDPAMPSPAALADLNAFVAAGGNVISLFGPALGEGRGGPAALPAGLLRRWRVPDPGTFLEVAQPHHPAVAALTDIAGGVPWNAFRISQYWQFAPAASDVVVMRYAGTDHPALVQRDGAFAGSSAQAAATPSPAAAATSAPGTTTGTPNPATGGPATGGSHLILTTPLPALRGPAASWNELFSAADAWPVFLLIRQMAQSLVDQGQGTPNLLITELPSLRLDLDQAGEPAAADPAAAATAETAATAAEPPGPPADAPPRDVLLQMFPPRGPAVPLRPSGDRVTIGNVDQPGTYWLRGAGLRTGFSVNLLPGQTDLTRLDAAQLETWLGADRFDLVHDREQIREAEGRGEPSRPLYGWLLLVMAGALLLEQVLANRFYASSRRSPRSLGPFAAAPSAAARQAARGPAGQRGTATARSVRPEGAPLA